MRVSEKIFDENIASTQRKIIDLKTMRTISIQAVYSNAAPSAKTFDSARRASGTITIVDYTALAGAEITVGADVLVEGVDWTAATSNAATAASLAGAIDALASVSASDDGADVDILAATAGTAGNAIALASDNADATVSGANLSGGAASEIDQDNNNLSIPNHGLVTGTKVAATTSGAFPSPLTATDYYVIKVDKDTIALATSLANAEAGTKVNLASDGDPDSVHTLTPATASGNVLKLQKSNDGSNWKDLGSFTVTIATSAGSEVWEVGEASFQYLGILYTPSAGQIDLELHQSYVNM